MCNKSIIKKARLSFLIQNTSQLFALKASQLITLVFNEPVFSKSYSLTKMGEQGLNDFLADGSHMCTRKG